MFAVLDSKLTDIAKRLSFLAILIAAAAFLPTQGNAAALKSKDVNKALAGHTLVLSAMGIKIPITYHTDGSIEGAMAAYVASLAGESALKDKGKWWTEADKLCQRWENWLGKKKYCFTLSLKGSLIHWSSDDGHSGTGKIATK